MTHSRRLHVFLHALAGGVVILLAAFVDPIMGWPARWGRTESLGVAVGLLIVTVGFLPQRLESRGARASAGLCVSLLGLITVLALSEGLFRLLRFDFAAEERHWRQRPVYYRQPRTPTGTVFFKRPEHERWTGQVLSRQLELNGISPNPFKNEPVMTVQYDFRGFRNADDLTTWEIAVAGDSFTELGYLEQPQLFTSTLAEKLGRPVLNLGTSHTGPLTQLSYLDTFGASSGLKHTLIVFFEGNDLDDLARETEAVRQWTSTGKRGYREFRQQTSLIRAAYSAVYELFLGRSDRWPDQITAHFQSAEGPVPVTFYYTPPGSAQLSAATMRQLEEFFAQYEAWGHRQRVTPWLAYMPTKERVLYGQVTFAPSAPDSLRRWQPTDLPEVIRRLSERHGIRFVDLTPALTANTKRTRELAYNSIHDTHLNALGSRIVGEELARRMSGPK